MSDTTNDLGPTETGRAGDEGTAPDPSAAPAKKTAPRKRAAKKTTKAAKTATEPATTGPATTETSTTERATSEPATAEQASAPAKAAPRRKRATAPAAAPEASLGVDALPGVDEPLAADASLAADALGAEAPVAQPPKAAAKRKRATAKAGANATSPEAAAIAKPLLAGAIVTEPGEVTGAEPEGEELVVTEEPLLADTSESAPAEPATDEDEDDEPASSATGLFGLVFQPPEPPRGRRASRPAGAATPPTAAERAAEAEAAAAGDADRSDQGAGADQAPATGRAPRSGRGGRGAKREQQGSTDQQDKTGQQAQSDQRGQSDQWDRTEPAGQADAGSDRDPGAESDDGDQGGEGAGGSRSRRRRGGRGRKVRGAEDDNGAEAADETSAQGEQSPDSGPSDDAGGEDDDANNPARRRRRRRRSGAGGEGDDPPGTVTRVRETRRDRDEVTSVRGSTRLEAKKQRRREGREAGRRRTIITEKEFLARRESVERVMVVRRREGRTQIGVLEDGILVEHYVSRTTNASMAGNIYLGRVQNVLPSMEAAFVDIGRGRNAVLYAGEVNWDVAGLQSGEGRRIENVLSSGESVLVQVTKDPIGHKGARLTSQISLPGRYLVYVPQGSMTGISRKLPDTERSRLKAILKEIVPADAGVIVRTAAEGASEEELRRDVERLAKTWERVKAASEGKAGKKAGGAPVLLNSEPDLTVRVIRDVFNEDFSSLVVAGDDVWDEIREYVEDVAPDLAPRMTKWTEQRDIFTAHRVDEQLTKALDRKVFLPSGGSLVIDRTEAMTVVDVNTGKFVGSGGNLEETVTKNNLEAAEEIVRQLRLRDIGGIIVIDFIDMVLEANRDLVVRRLLECLGRDRTKHQVAEVTSLGLVQMTRKRVASGLLEVFSEPCEHCNGRGVIVRSSPVDAAEESDSEHSHGDSGRGGNAGRRGRGKQQSEPAKAPEPQPVRSGPTAAQIAAAAHAAALKSHNGHGGDHGPDAGSASGTESAPAAAPSPAEDVTAVYALSGPADQVAGDQGAGDRPVDDAEQGQTRARAGAGPGVAAVPDGAAGAENGIPDSDATGQRSGGRGRRRRGRATAPAGPPRSGT